MVRDTQGAQTRGFGRPGPASRILAALAIGATGLLAAACTSGGGKDVLVACDPAGASPCADGWTCVAVEGQPYKGLCQKVADTPDAFTDPGTAEVHHPHDVKDPGSSGGDPGGADTHPGSDPGPDAIVATDPGPDAIVPFDAGPDAEECPGCAPGRVCYKGRCLACVPDAPSCQGSVVQTCKEDGSGFTLGEDCDPGATGRTCVQGVCTPLCDADGGGRTNRGCEFWATDLDQYSDSTDATYGGGKNGPYAVVVANLDASYTATVRVTNASGFDQSWQAPPGVATILNLPPNNIEGSGVSDHAWHVTSTLPVVAYQFNPLENVGVYSNDASLLLPVGSLGTRYRGLSWPTIGQNSDAQSLASFLAIVATADGNTTVTVTPTANVMAGTGVDATPAGTPRSWTLARGQVLNLETATVGGDLTGSDIQADRPISVFGGHVCADAPISRCTAGHCSYDPTVACAADADCPAIAACDHLEEQLQPVEALGSRYVVARTVPRGQAPDVVRVLAVQDGTQISGAPVAAPVLNAGQVFEFEITDAVELAGNHAFAVGHYLEGQDAPYSAHSGCYDSASGNACESVPGGSCVCDGLALQACTTQAQCSPDDANIGDPAFIVGVPVQQFRSAYVFLAPTKYRDNYVSIVAPAAASVVLDGETLAAATFQALPSGQWKVARLPVPTGSHVLSADVPVGLEVYGWDFYVSYGYPGGMNVEALPGN